jgi:CheY-like chemotaxis protein
MRQALDLATSENQLLDLLLSDIGLLDGTGWELLQHLNAAGCRPRRAIALSDLRAEEDLQRSKAVGFDWHLSEPTELASIARCRPANPPKAVIAITGGLPPFSAPSARISRKSLKPFRFGSLISETTTSGGVL